MNPGSSSTLYNAQRAGPSRYAPPDLDLTHHQRAILSDLTGSVRARSFGGGGRGTVLFGCPPLMVPVITQLLQVLFAVTGLMLGLALQRRCRGAGRLCVAGGVVLLLGAGFEILWLTLTVSVFGPGSLPRVVAGAFAVEFVEAVLEGAGWLLLALAVLADRGGVGERGR